MDFFSLSLYQKNINLCSPQRMHASLYGQIKESLTAAQYLAFETVFMSGACLWWCLWKQLTGFWNIASYATCNETWMSLLKLFVIERMLSQAQGVLCVGHTAPGGWRLWSPAGATEGTDPLRGGHTTHHPRLSVRDCLAVMNHSFLT